MIEPVVLIPGQMADSRLFLPQMVDLVSKLPMHVCLPTDGDTVEGLSQTPLDHAPKVRSGGPWVGRFSRAGRLSAR